MLLLHMQIRRYINKICDNTSFLFALVLWSLINKNTSLVTYHLIYNKSYTTVVSIRARTVHPSGIPEFSPVLVGIVLLSF